MELEHDHIRVSTRKPRSVRDDKVMTRSWPGFDPREGRRGSREEAAQQEGNHRAAAKRQSKVGPTATAATADYFQFGTPWTITQHHTTIPYHTEYIPIHFPFLDLDASPFYILIMKAWGQATDERMVHVASSCHT
jgi:hypothetical protein